MAEVAPDELGLFPERCRAYFRRRKGHGRDPLAMGIEAWTSVVTFAALSTVQSVLVFVAAEFKKGVEEEGASTIRAWIKRGFRRLAPPTDESPDSSVVVVDPAEGDTARGGEERGIPWTEAQLGRIREHAYRQAREFNVPPARASKLADTIVAKLVLPGSGDD
ncbi:hypothetical protein ILP97_01485 [Amycolatopsis sp. H6(2020)]|nr:hypothetical protein [Amycolatopsis sp. H6(2020)]